MMINLVKIPAGERIGRDYGQPGLVQYRLAAFPGEELRLSICAEREEFRRSFGVEIPNDAPLLCIASFQAKEMMESVLSRWLQRICSTLMPQSLELNNYSSFPQNSIFLRVQDPAVMNQLAQQLEIIDEYIRSNDCPALRFHGRPGITIAENLAPEVYEKAIGVYSRKTFHARLEISELSLLKKIEPYGGFRKANVFHLAPAGSTI